MSWLILVAVLVVLLFASAILFGAPFLPTLRQQTVEALDLLALQPGQILLELGSGDGRVLREAAKRGVQSIGYEINPILVIYSKLLSWRQRKLITIHWRNFWHAPFHSADAIYVFLLNPYMSKLNTKITREVTKPIKVVSFAFAFPTHKPTKEKNGLMLYKFDPVSSKAI